MRRYQRGLAYPVGQRQAQPARQDAAREPRPGRAAWHARGPAGGGSRRAGGRTGWTPRVQPGPRRHAADRSRPGGRAGGRRPLVRQAPPRTSARRCDPVNAKDDVEALMRSAQGELVAAFEDVDGEGRFTPHSWTRSAGGGGTAMVLEGGRIFAKTAINVSAVWGEEVPPSLAAQHPRAAGQPFFATGLSLISHAVNPYVPAFHANYRYFKVGPPR